MAKCW